METNNESSSKVLTSHDLKGGKKECFCGDTQWFQLKISALIVLRDFSTLSDAKVTNDFSWVVANFIAHRINEFESTSE